MTSKFLQILGIGNCWEISTVTTKQDKGQLNGQCKKIFSCNTRFLKSMQFALRFVSNFGI